MTLGVHETQAAEVAPGAAAEVVAGGIGEEAVLATVPHGRHGDVFVAVFLTVPAVGVGRLLGGFFDLRAVVGAVKRLDFEALAGFVVVVPAASALSAHQPVERGHAPGDTASSS